MPQNNQDSVEIIRYIRHNRGDRRHLIGCMVAFKRDRTSNKFYIGWSLKHKEDWGLYAQTCSGDEVIIGALPFDKKIALETARSRAIKWTMEPCEAPPIPNSIEDEFLLFLDRAMRYFKTTSMPEWVSQEYEDVNFQEVIQILYNNKTEKKQQYIQTLHNNAEWYQKQMELCMRKIKKISKNV